MSAVGRLWRRAPAWRLSLGAAIAFTAMAAMFPPTLPPWLRTWPPRLTGAAPDSGTTVPAAAGTAEGGKDAAARYVPQSAPAVPDYGVVAFPPLGPGRSGTIPFAGRLLPLPAGSWQELVLARSGGFGAEQATLLARIEDDHLTGLMLAAAPGPVSRGTSPVTGLAACFAPDAIAHEVIPAPASAGLAARECWTLAAFDMRRAASRADTDAVMRGGLDRLGEMHVAVPGRMLALQYLRSDDSGWFTALLLLPDRHGDLPGASRPLQAWVRRFVSVLHKGFDGTLTAGELPPAVAHDPD